MIRNKFIAFLMLGLVAVSCNVTKRLPEESLLYNGFEIKIKDPSNLDDRSVLIPALEEYSRPDPNKRFFGFRTKLWIYQHTKEPTKEKGLRYFLKRKLGEAPVLASMVDENNVAVQMNQHLFSEGYFKSDVIVQRMKSRKTMVNYQYQVKLGPHYKIDTLEFDTGSNSFMLDFGACAKSCLVHPSGGQYYSLALLDAERARFESELKNRGYYFFNRNQLIFRADTSVGNHQVRLILTLKPDLPPKTKRQFSLSEVRVNTHFAAGKSMDSDTLYNSGIVFYKNDSLFDPDKIERFINLREGDLYSRKEYELTLKKVSRLEAFDFVNITFSESDSSHLDALVNMTPAKKRSIRSKFNLVSKSNNFSGPNMELTWINRNLFKGAEYLDLTFNSGFETQILSGVDPLFSYEFGFTGKYVVPKVVNVLTLFGLGKDTATGLPPKTTFKLGYNHVNRVNYYRLNSFNAGYGYQWRSSAFMLHSLDLLTVNYMQVGNVSVVFQKRLDENLGLKRSFEQQLIVGPAYSLTFTPAPTRGGLLSTYLMLSGETAGNVGFLFNELSGKPTPTAAKPNNFLGVPVAQFVKIQADGRAYLKTGEKSKFAIKQFVGYGLPYRKTASLPFSRQYFSGGASSLRAFPFRSVGPGSSLPDTSSTAFLFIDQSGDIKLESSIEYRFPIQDVLRGAVFADAGNVWLQNNALNKPNGVFRVNQVLNELAVGVGAGLRLDLDFFVLRFDVATPLRKPYLPENNRWVIDQMRFGQKAWRQQNIVYNIAIGYPF